VRSKVLKSGKQHVLAPLGTFSSKIESLGKKEIVFKIEEEDEKKWQPGENIG